MKSSLEANSTAALGKEPILQRQGPEQVEMKKAQDYSPSLSLAASPRPLPAERTWSWYRRTVCSSKSCSLMKRRREGGFGAETRSCISNTVPAWVGAAPHACADAGDHGEAVTGTELGMGLAAASKGFAGLTACRGWQL